MIKTTLVCDGCGEKKYVEAKSGTYRSDIIGLEKYQLMRQVEFHYYGYEKKIMTGVDLDRDKAYLLCPECFEKIEELIQESFIEVNQKIKTYFNRFKITKQFGEYDDKRKIN